MILLPQTDLDPKGPQLLPVALQQRMWASQTGLAVVQRQWMLSETDLVVVQHQWMWAETVLARSQMDLQSTVAPV